MEDFDLELLLSGKQEVFGLDIGAYSVKVVQLRKDSDGYVVSAAAKADVSQTDSGNTDQKKLDVVSAIRECVKSAHIHSRYAVCGVCGPDVAVRSFSFLSLPDAEIPHAIILEAEQVCPFETGQSIVDYQVIANAAVGSSLHGNQAPMHEGNGVTSGILVAATNEVIIRRRQLIKEAKLHCVFMDVNSLALLNWLLEDEELLPGQTMAVLDIGGSFTNLAVMRHNGLPFIRDIAYAGNDIINHIAIEHKISAQDVRSILYGGKVVDQRLVDVGASFKKACNKLVTNITQTLRYYMVQETVHVDKIYICGGFSQAHGLIELLDSQLPSDVQLWHPFMKVRCQAGMPGMHVLQEHGSSMAVAAGLAMRMI
ncbi:MAG: hypothetical protein E4H40_01835 [Candidatus Brocadiia bacterium]|nr:MAG: hypothetical protein E4H40_01835 [Candidatus Brocadiia bacterium]